MAPAASDAEGRRAFDDLAHYYASQDSVPRYRAALRTLASAKATERQAAGRYLLRLLEQSLADETNGRAEWKATPFWGGGKSSRAHEFRENLADAFGDSATGEEALPALEWLLEHEPDPEIQAGGAPALGRVRGPAGTELLGRFLREPHTNAPVLVDAIRAARSQSLASLIPAMRGLSLDYRESVRQAAGEALVAMGAGPPPPWRPTAAFPGWLAKDLRTCAHRVWTRIPTAARWSLFRVEHETIYKGHPYTQRVSGWLLAEDDTAYRVLDEFGQEQRLSRRHTVVLPQTLSEEAARIVALRHDPHVRDIDVADSLSRGGGLTGQFESRDLSLPEILLAAWSFERGDTTSAAALLFPRLDALGDEHRFDVIARDLLGNLYHIAMLAAFSYDRDYPRTIALAEHLARPLFDGYGYQPRARELRVQLAHRRSDFHEFALPDSVEWERLRRTLDRPRQITYLSERLRLLNCFQQSQPGGPDLRGDQYASPTHMSSSWDAAPNHSRRVINPYVELTAMHPTPADIPSLAPLLADVRYMPTFEFWRDFHPERNLYRVCDVAAWMIEDIAQQSLVDPDSIPGTTPERRRAMVERIATWGRARGAMSPEDQRVEVLKTTKVGYEFRIAVETGLASGDPRVPPIVLARIDEFPGEEGWLYKLCAGAKTDAFVPLAKRRVDTPVGHAESAGDAMAREFYSGLILVRHGDPAGVPAVRKVLASDADGDWIREAVEPLLATRDPEARDALCAGARNPKLLLHDENSTLLRRLFRAGCDGIADSLLARLQSSTPHGQIYSRNPRTGDPIERSLVEGDMVADYVATWRPGAVPFDKLAPDEQRARRRDEIRVWLAEQARRMRTGEALDMRP